VSDVYFFWNGRRSRLLRQQTSLTLSSVPRAGGKQKKKRKTEEEGPDRSQST
jgi:hypothetical protein